MDINWAEYFDIGNLTSFLKPSFILVVALIGAFLLFSAVKFVVECFKATERKDKKEEPKDKTFGLLMIKLMKASAVCYLLVWASLIAYTIATNKFKITFFKITFAGTKELILWLNLSILNGLIAVLLTNLPHPFAKLFIAFLITFYFYNLTNPETSPSLFTANRYSSIYLLMIVNSTILKYCLKFNEFVINFKKAIKKLLMNYKVFLPAITLASLIISLQLVIINLVLYALPNYYFSAFAVLIISEWSFNLIINLLTVFLGSFLFQSNSNLQSHSKSLKLCKIYFSEICFKSFTPSLTKALTNAKILCNCLVHKYSTHGKIYSVLSYFSATIDNIEEFWIDNFFYKIAIKNENEIDLNIVEKVQERNSIFLLYLIGFKTLAFRIPMIMATLGVFFQIDFLNDILKTLNFLSGFSSSSTIVFFSILTAQQTLTTFAALFTYIFTVLFVSCIPIAIITTLIYEELKLTKNDRNQEETALYKHFVRLSISASKFEPIVSSIISKWS